MLSYNLCHPSKILNFQPTDIIFYSLQQSVAGCCSPHGSTFLPPPECVPSAWGASYDILKYIEFAMRVQHTHKSSNWCSRTLQSDQNEVQMGAWSRSNQQKGRKVKSNENNSIYYTSDRSGLQKYIEFLFKNHKESCLQSRHAFWCLKSSKIPNKWSQSGALKPPKDDLNSLKIIAVTFKDSTECIFAPSDDQNGAKVALQHTKTPPKWHPRPRNQPETNSQLCQFVDANLVGKYSYFQTIRRFQSCRIFKSC